MSEGQSRNEDFRIPDMVPAIEFSCWTVILLAPWLRIINGASVTGDQLAIQLFLFSGAVAGACILRIYDVLCHRRIK